MKNETGWRVERLFVLKGIDSEARGDLKEPWGTPPVLLGSWQEVTNTEVLEEKLELFLKPQKRGVGGDRASESIGWIRIVKK